MNHSFSKLLALCLLFVCAPVLSQNQSEVVIKTTHVAGSVYMLEGRGGNIGVSSGVDGVLVIDDQFANLSKKIKTAIKKINPAPIEFLFNTHHHGDHAGGNKNFGKDATIIAHHNVRGRIASKEDMVAEELPVITFSDDLSIHFNGEEIKAMHLPNGHTDGDIAIYFTKSNVVHMGDQFFNGGFPYIDLGSGGNAKNYAKNVKAMIDAVPLDAKIIPGHGALTNIAGLKSFYKMLNDNIAYVKGLMASGKSLQEVQAKGVLPQYKYLARDKGAEDRWLEIVYNSLK